jgi:hypothetical protein
MDSLHLAIVFLKHIDKSVQRDAATLTQAQHRHNTGTTQAQRMHSAGSRKAKAPSKISSFGR